MEKKKQYTLNQLLIANFEIKDISKIIIKDSDDDIPDVFKTGETKEELRTSINKYSTIGVVGEWGIGKSTLINSTITEINKNNYIIIDDFDPWAIKSQDALILAMYNTIMGNLGKNIGYFKRKKVQNALINITTNIPYVGKGIGNYFENRIDDYTEYKEIKADLEEKLEKFDKRLIFIIDNLDRMNSNNVLFLLTLIETLFKLPKITYILAYDKNRLNDIFKDNRLNLKYLEKIINKEIFMPILDRDTLEDCIENLINIYNYNLQNPKVVKLICKRFTNIRQFIHFCNYLTKKPDFLNVFIKQKIESDYFIIQAIKYLDYNTYLNIYNDRESLVDIKQRTETISNKYKDYEDLMNLLFSESENRKYSILNPILFKRCYLPIELKTQRIKDCLDELLSNYKDFSQKTDELNNTNYEMYQKKVIIYYLKLTSHSSKYDIMYFFSFLEYEITFNIKEFKDKIVLWDLFNKCTSNNKNSIYNLIVSNKDIPKLSRYLDENIVSVLITFFESFVENKQYNKFLEDTLEEYHKNQEEYCKKIIVYEYNFNEIPNELLNSTIDKMYSPILNDPIIIKDEEIFSKFYSYLAKRYGTWSYVTLNYIDKLLCKAVAKGENLYEFINFFIIERSLFYNLSNLISDIILNSTYIHDLIEKYPPKDDNEEKIKRDFEEKYPIRYKIKE
ncbi:P-loop NTPase fold protein [uncultured Parvimonas sp.]|uniref:KAP family P-loop NTPase fold protein n=1 Tax=uncultured Parvimonas sp. TaxID=747372 RepID=UPI0028D70293|nr:P-loop NTPase fold protein [uncultured Parvimonas sp.]